MDQNQLLSKMTLVAFDTETSGAYPIGYDVVEFGAIKWQGGVEVARLQFLFKPREPMSDFIIGIHGITNEMVESAPLIADKIHEIHEFFSGCVVMAHHAPFDLGFMALEFEKAKLPLPTSPVLCTSLLSRRLVHETANHKLQTLVKHFGFDGGAAHRAFDDAKSCLMVGLECASRLGEQATLLDAIKAQVKKLEWKDYALYANNQMVVRVIVEAIHTKKRLDLIYDGGSTKGEVRQVNPIGVVRNPDGDYLMAFCLRDKINKRYYLNRITDTALIF